MNLLNDTKQDFKKPELENVQKEKQEYSCGYSCHVEW